MLDILFWRLKASPLAWTRVNCNFWSKKFSSVFFFFSFWSSTPWIRIGSGNPGFTWNAGSGSVSGSTALLKKNTSKMFSLRGSRCVSRWKKGVFLKYFNSTLRHLPPLMTVTEDAWIEHRTVATFALAVRPSKDLARPHPDSVRSHPHSARSHPHSARSHPHSARSHQHSARSHPWVPVSVVGGLGDLNASKIWLKHGTP